MEETLDFLLKQQLLEIVWDQQQDMDPEDDSTLVDLFGEVEEELNNVTEILGYVLCPGQDKILILKNFKELLIFLDPLLEKYEKLHFMIPMEYECVLILTISISSDPDKTGAYFYISFED